MWKNSIINIKESQTEYYTRNKACPEVLKLVGLESKSFGMQMERIVREMFCLSKPINSQHDAILNDKKIEIKSARYWSSSTDCRWQHIEIDYDYDYVLFALVDFQDLHVWGMHKNKLKNMIEMGILTPQGRQGYWTKMSLILPHLSVVSLDSLVQDIKEDVNIVL